MAQVGIYELLPGTMQPHHHNASADGDFLWADVRAFGAIDGAPDNTVPFQNAIASGAGVFVPTGTWITRQIVPINYTRFFGMGFSSIIKLKNGSNQELIYPLNKTGISFENLLLDGNKAGQVGAGWATVKLEGCTDSYFDKVFLQNGSYTNITLKDCYRIFGDKIYSKNPAKVGLYLTNSFHNKFNGFDHETDVGGLSGYHGILVYNGSMYNQFERVNIRTTAQLDGVTFHTGCHRNKLLDAIFIGCGNGFEASGADYFEVSEIFYDNNAVAIGAEAGIEIYNCKKGRVSGAMIKSPMGAGLYVHGGSENNIFERIISESAQLSGFLINASVRNKFANCKALINIGRGYYFLSGANWNELVGSDAYNNGSGGPYPGILLQDSNYIKILGGQFIDNDTWGIEEAGSSNYTQVRAGLFQGNPTGSISLSGAQSVQTDNMSL